MVVNSKNARYDCYRTGHALFGVGIEPTDPGPTGSPGVPALPPAGPVLATAKQLPTASHQFRQPVQFLKLRIKLSELFRKLINLLLNLRDRNRRDEFHLRFRITVLPRACRVSNSGKKVSLLRGDISSCNCIGDRLILIEARLSVRAVNRADQLMQARKQSLCLLHEVGGIFCRLFSFLHTRRPKHPFPQIFDPVLTVTSFGQCLCQFQNKASSFN